MLTATTPAGADTTGWVAEPLYSIDNDCTVTTWYHPDGARIDDNTNNVPADLRDLTPEQLAETAFVGHHPGGAWEQFPTFAEAAAFALTPPCGFEPNGRRCPNPATVIVTLAARPRLASEDVPTCATCLPNWLDEVQATARPIATADA